MAIRLLSGYDLSLRNGPSGSIGGSAEAHAENTATPFRARPDAGTAGRGHPVAMRSTGYAAVWQDGGPAMAGRVVLDASALAFEGRQASRRIAFTSIASSA